MKRWDHLLINGRPLLSNVEKITSAILPLASNILFPPLPFRLFSNLFSVTMLALLLRISSKIAQKCRCKIAELILSILLKKQKHGASKRAPHAFGNLRGCFQWSLPASLCFRHGSSGSRCGSSADALPLAGMMRLQGRQNPFSFQF